LKHTLATTVETAANGLLDQGCVLEQYQSMLAKLSFIDLAATGTLFPLLRTPTVYWTFGSFTVSQPDHGHAE
jgi:hypothetical protein